jgi:tetraacyldisaccharide 4'-kinase
MNLIRLIFFPFSIIYGGIIAIRNFLFRKNIRRSVKFDVPIVCVGNLSTGGTGKTPHTELLIEKLSNVYEIGVLSRGYKRLTKGFVRADSNSSWEDVGDEPLQYFFKYENKVSVQVDEERIRGVIHTIGDLPKTELILLDDAYQHRSLIAGFNILLTDFKKPFFKDFILPVGNLREFRSGKNRADYIVVTKCPDLLSNDIKKEYINKIAPNSHQKVFFSSIEYKGIFNLDGVEISKLPENILLVTGIANPSPIKEKLKDLNVVHLEYPDHYRFKDRDIKKITDLFGTFAVGNKIILTTVKDLMRLKIFKNFCEEYKEEIHYLDISIRIEDENEFIDGIKKYVDENKGDSSIH